MIDHSSASRFSTGVPVSAIRCRAGSCADRGRLPGRRVLDGLRLVDHEPAPLDRGQRGRVAGGQRVGGDDQVGLGDGPRERLAARPARRRGARAPAASGANLAASRCQLPTSDIGQTSSVGPASAGSPASSASSCTVLPSPMSSARTPPSPGPLQEVQPGQARAPGRAAACRRTRRRRHRLQPPVGVGRPADRRASPRPRRPTTGRPPGASADPPARCSSSPTVNWASGAAIIRSPAASRRGSSSTHWPRSRTSGALSVVSRRSSSAVSGSSPSASSHS